MLHSTQSGFLVQENGSVMGVLSRDDIIKGLTSHGEDVRLREVMSTGFTQIDADTSLRDLFRLMQRERTDLLPVFEDQKLIGVIDQEKIREFIMVQSALREV